MKWFNNETPSEQSARQNAAAAEINARYRAKLTPEQLAEVEAAENERKN